MLTDTENVLSQLTESSHDGEGKFFTIISGEILFHSDHQFGPELKKGDNIIAFINTHEALLNPEQVKNLQETNSGLRFKFSIVNEKTQWFDVLVSSISIDDSKLLFFQLFDISETENIGSQITKKKKRIEDELMLRTQEINMTHTLMNEHGGYLKNFLRGLRHDLISPIVQLQQIIAYYQNADDPDKKLQSKKLIDVSLNKLSNTANGFSEFVDLHFKFQHDFEAVDLLQTFEATKLLFTNELKEVEINFKINFDQAPTVFFSQKFLESIFYNLLSNSLKFRSTQRPLQIEMSSHNEADKTVLVIKDNGIGFDAKKYKEQLFQPFKRLNNTHEGAGVGLSLVHSIMKRNGGEVFVESENEKGCEVKVVFPVKS